MGSGITTVIAQTQTGFIAGGLTIPSILLEWSGPHGRAITTRWKPSALWCVLLSKAAGQTSSRILQVDVSCDQTQSEEVTCQNWIQMLVVTSKPVFGDLFFPNYFSFLYCILTINKKQTDDLCLDLKQKKKTTTWNQFSNILKLHLNLFGHHICISTWESKSFRSTPKRPFYDTIIWIWNGKASSVATQHYPLVKVDVIYCIGTFCFHTQHFTPTAVIVIKVTIKNNNKNIIIGTMLLFLFSILKLLSILKFTFSPYLR